MARSVRDARLETRAARAKLAPRGKPYYRALDPGLHLGYRKSQNGGKWLGRFYLGDGGYKTETIATADDKADADGIAVLDFRQAQARIREKHLDYTRITKGLPAKDDAYTIRACLEEYLAFLAANRKSAGDARCRAEALILPQLGDLPCTELTAAILRKWRDEAAASPPRLRTRNGDEQKYREINVDDAEAKRRRRATANRTLAILKAALNRAWRDGKIATEDAWRRVEPFGGAMRHACAIS